MALRTPSGACQKRRRRLTWVVLGKGLVIGLLLEAVVFSIQGFDAVGW